MGSTVDCSELISDRPLNASIGLLSPRILVNTACRHSRRCCWCDPWSNYRICHRCNSITKETKGKFSTIFVWTRKWDSIFLDFSVPRMQAFNLWDAFCMHSCVLDRPLIYTAIQSYNISIQLLSSHCMREVSFFLQMIIYWSPLAACVLCQMRFRISCFAITIMQR